MRVHRWFGRGHCIRTTAIQTVQPACPRADTCETEGALPSGAATNTNGGRYSRSVVSVSSVNVIANPVRVAPIPKVIAHVPTNINITTSGVGL